jgi:aspartate/methionine/tyrosine aminotransferase
MRFLPGAIVSDATQWLDSNAASAKYSLGGSTAPQISLDELIALSSDPAKTKEALQFFGHKLKPGPAQGSLPLRQNIAKLYDGDILAEDIVTATGTTGSNVTALHSLVQAGDHVIIQYPIYSQLIGLPKSFQCEISLWKFDPEKAWQPDIDELRKLIRPSTKLIVLNNPGNPTGKPWSL